MNQDLKEAYKIGSITGLAVVVGSFVLAGLGVLLGL
jgi:hypothetical protein